MTRHTNSPLLDAMTTTYAKSPMRIVTLRQNLGLTQLELASMLRVHQSTISKLESSTLVVEDADFWARVERLEQCWEDALAIAQRGAVQLFRLREGRD